MSENPMTSPHRIRATLLAATLASGCASVNMADPAQDAARKSVTAPSVTIVVRSLEETNSIH
jgi:hypothetical protein